MTEGKRERFSATQKNDIWCRWNARQSLHMIGRAFGKPHTSIHCLLSITVRLWFGRCLLLALISG
jgi:hypothetical protein